jgi:hypothetical protein
VPCTFRKEPTSLTDTYTAIEIILHELPLLSFADCPADNSKEYTVIRQLRLHIVSDSVKMKTLKPRSIFFDTDNMDLI